MVRFAIGVLITVIVIACLLIAALLSKLEKTESMLNYYRYKLNKILNNETLVKEAMEIISDAYGVSEADLKDFLSNREE